MIFLSGYGIRKTTYRGTKNAYYAGERKRDGKPVVIKIPLLPFAGEKELIQLTHEHDILSHLNIEGVPKSCGIERYRDGLALILEAFPGLCLAELIRSKGIDIGDALMVSGKLAEILGGLHGQHLIHKDIKPESIFYDPDSGSVWLTDFGNASFDANYSYKNPQPAIPGGTIHYMSPEQTGRLSRSVDFRTDFYSLGVTLYEVLTGTLPFTGSDNLEIVYSHLARQPTPPHEINILIPKIVSAIVMKLLAKSPEERYQSAWGLKADLDECLRQLEAKGEIAYFPPAMKDVSDRLNIPQKLYGREQEKDSLLRCFESLGDGAARMIMVAGYSGIGKTSLVQEIHRPLIARTGYYIRGKFDQLHHDIPYSGLVQAFQDLIDQILSESETRLKQWNGLLSVLGANLRVIIEVIPDLELVTGPQPPLMELGADESQNRFNLIFLEFMRVFCRQEHPVVILLDDLQWVDKATLKLIELIMSMGELHHLLLIGAYRKNEVAETHPLMITLNAVVKKGGLIRYIDVPPLSFESVADMIADTLHKNREEIKDLAELITFKTGGNPFFISHFLTTLHQEKQLTFDTAAKSWKWDITKIKALAITDNVIDLLVHRFHHMSAATRFILQMAACIGSRFDMKMLCLITGFAAPAIRRDLAPAVQMDLLIPIRSIRVREINAEDPQEAEVYRFQHDRVQQAAYTLIPPAKRKSLHIRIGQAFLENFDPEKKSEDVFDILTHLNFGAERIVSSEERLNLARLNLMAGRKAKSSVAFEPALNYIRTGIALLPADSFMSCYELSLNLHLECLETLRLCGCLDEMAAVFSTAIKFVHTPLDAVGAYKSRIKGLMARDRLREALVTAREILNQLGVDMPERVNITESKRVLKDTMDNLAVKEIEAFIALPVMTDPLQLATMDILVTMISLIYIGAPDLFSHLLCKQVNASIRHGNAPGSAFLYAAFSVLLCRLGEDTESGYRFGVVALALAENPHNREHKGQALHCVSGYINHWKLPLGDTLNLAIRGYQSALEVGDFEFASYNIYCYCKHAFLSGGSLEAVEREMDGYHHAIKKLNQETSLRFHGTFHQTVRNLLGRSPDPCRFPDGDETLLRLYMQSSNRLGIFYLYFCKLLLHYLFGHYQEAIHYADLAQRETVYEYGGPLAVPLTVFYGTLARLARYRNAAPKERRQILKKVADAQRKMKKWAEHGPANYRQKFHLIEAERSSVMGDDHGAIEHYHRAIESSRAHGFINDEALANELAAGYWRERNMPAFAEPFIRRAYACYMQWECYAKASQMEENHPELLAKQGMETTAKGQQATAHSDAFSPGLDLATVMKASQAISGQIELEKLLSALMRFVVENTGAERGSLILCTDGDLSIAAQCEAETDEVRILPSLPIEAARDVSPAIVHYVARTGDWIVMHDATREGLFTNDPYILNHGSRSLLCGPIIHKTRLVSILYLESRLIAGVFSAGRREMIEMLTSQMAVSIDNARLYERLKKAEEKYRSIFENAVEGIYQTTLGGQFISANPAMAKMLGYDSSEDLMSHVIDIGKHLYVSEAARKQLLDMISEKKFISGFEVQFYRKDGSTLWASLHARLVIDQEGKPSSIEGLFADITDSKRATEALRESEENLRKENLRLRSSIKDQYRFGNIIGKSAAMKEIYEFILKAAAGCASVIIYGESGTGKELVARAIHEMTDRKDNAFIPVNCGAIPENLMESEFFGYKKGAFTGANRDKQGYLDLADKGTLFLDELGELSLTLQVKLLRVLEGHGYIPVGGNEVRQSNARFIAATNRDLLAQVKQSQMREDFFYRIHIIPIHIPPLRDRKEDIPLLVEHFTNEFGAHTKIPPLTGRIWEDIMRYDWPGNIRELQNVLHRYFTLNTFNLEISPDKHFAAAGSQTNDHHRTAIDLYEKNLIEATLRENQWHREKTASCLGMSRRTFFRKLKKYGLS
ncbi:MAG: sigma 54-interacting transcriptional regulator [Deltaproteobacteria bacterium]|nr:sigma 54-interacting transcriptional regulator [Deltaproteobacteria bacterium]